MGDATREILTVSGNTRGGWYSSASRLLYDDPAWVQRGGNFGDSYAGLFTFYMHQGKSDPATTFRVVLTHQDGKE